MRRVRETHRCGLAFNDGFRNATGVVQVVRPRHALLNPSYAIPAFSRSVIQKVIDAGGVLVNGNPAKASYKIRNGDHAIACRS